MDFRSTYRLTLACLAGVIPALLDFSGETIVIPIKEGAQGQETAVHSKMVAFKNGLVSCWWMRVKKRKKLLIGAVLWALVISLIVIKVHWFHYLQNPRFSYYRYPLSYRGPQMGSIDIIILWIVSTLFGVLLSEADSIIIGYMLALTMSFVGLVVYVVLYIWFVLDWGELLSLVPGTAGLEMVIFWGILNATWIMFPGAVLMCLFGAIVGGVLRSWLRP